MNRGLYRNYLMTRLRGRWLFYHTEHEGHGDIREGVAPTLRDAQDIVDLMEAA